MKFFSEKDNGIYQAINKSIKLAKGKFIFYYTLEIKLFQNIF